MGKEVAIELHIYKDLEEGKTAEDIENELHNLLEEHGFATQVYDIEVREY